MPRAQCLPIISQHACLLSRLSLSISEPLSTGQSSGEELTEENADGKNAPANVDISSPEEINNENDSKIDINNQQTDKQAQNQGDAAEHNEENNEVAIDEKGEKCAGELYFFNFTQSSCSAEAGVVECFGYCHDEERCAQRDCEYQANDVKNKLKCDSCEMVGNAECASGQDLRRLLGKYKVGSCNDGSYEEAVSRNFYPSCILTSRA